MRVSMRAYLWKSLMRESEDCHVTVDAFLVIMTNSPRILNRQKRQTRRASAGFTRSRNSSARHPPPELFTSEPSDFRTPPPLGSAADGQVNKSHVRSPTRSSFLANETTTRCPVKVTNDPLSVAANVLPPPRPPPRPGARLPAGGTSRRGRNAAL